MKKLLLFLIPFCSFAELITFTPNQAIQATTINQNFEYLKNKLIGKNISIIFSEFSADEIIQKNQINSEILKINQAIGSDIQFVSDNITSQEFNTVFSSLNSRIIEFNAPPVITGKNYELGINESIDEAIIFSDPEESSLSFNIVQPPSNGVLSIVNGQIKYTPNNNFYGLDTFKIKANDGEKESNVANYSVSIKGEGIIISSGVRMYYDGSFASSCSEYYNLINGDKKYIGAIGNGIYKVGSSATVTCDMSTPNGPYTARTVWQASFADKFINGEAFVTGVNLGLTVNPSVGAGVRLVGIFNTISSTPYTNYIKNKNAYTMNGSSSGGSGGRYNFFGTASNIAQFGMWTNYGVPNDVNVIVLSNGVIGRITTISDGCSWCSDWSAYIYYYNASSASTIFWIKEN